MAAKVKITVIRRSLDKELIDEYLEDKHAELPRCDSFEDGQEFVVDSIYMKPEGFCTWAWADIRHVIGRVATGGVMTGWRTPGVEVAGCTDWFRPVLFRIERIDE